jgi:hypothetical protein
MLASRVVESLTAAGHEVERVSALPERIDAAALVCDLDAIDAEQAVALGVPVLGFYSHTDVATRDRAREAGLDVVVPRSRMVRELPELLEPLISRG